jgi:peroxiredoxin
VPESTASSLTTRIVAIRKARGGPQRYAALLEDGVVRQLMVEPDPLAVTVSSVAAVLDAL